MRILRANHLGMCFGVRDAIALALDRAQQAPLTILGELVHNENVVATLRQRGIRFQNDASKVPTADVMITAHGASDRTRDKLRTHGLNVLEATCPLVHHAHRTVQRLVQEQYYPIIVGQRDHVEVRGLTEDLVEFDVILSEEDVARLQERPRFGVASQTTQPIAKVRHLVELIRRRFPKSEVRFEDTVCQPTKQRQIAAVDVAKQAEVVVVVGGPHSNNTRELVKTCGRWCPNVHHVQTAADLRPEWFQGANIVGLTAGTSTPDGLIDSVEQWLLDFAAEADRVQDSAQTSAPEPVFSSRRAAPVAA
jgi:4-hydroxy-3-methylbut-2-en-1-yl diphosphate reductase